MALSTLLSFGMALPQRYPGAPAEPEVVRAVAQRAEALGFRDLWLTENTLDHVPCPDPLLLLSHVAAVTSRIRLGVAVVVLPVRHPAHLAHQAATLDYLSGGRAVLGVGLGRDAHYHEFGVPLERRVRRFTEGLALMRALWTQETVDFEGEVYRMTGAHMLPKPVQRPLPVWFGGAHPNALRRAAALADGWMGSGNSHRAAFAQQVALLRQALEAAGRDVASFPVSKRVFLSVHPREAEAYAELRHYMATVYRHPDLADRAGVWGTPEQVRERLAELAVPGVNHLLLHPVCRPAEQLEALAEVVGVPRPD